MARLPAAKLFVPMSQVFCTDFDLSRCDEWPNRSKKERDISITNFPDLVPIDVCPRLCSALHCYLSLFAIVVEVPTAWIQQRQNCSVIAEDVVPSTAYIFEVSTELNGYSDTLQAPRTDS